MFGGLQPWPGIPWSSATLHTTLRKSNMKCLSQGPEIVYWPAPARSGSVCGACIFLNHFGIIKSQTKHQQLGHSHEKYVSLCLSHPSLLSLCISVHRVLFACLQTINTYLSSPQILAPKVIVHLLLVAFVLPCAFDGVVGVKTAHVGVTRAQLSSVWERVTSPGDDAPVCGFSSTKNRVWINKQLRMLMLLNRPGTIWLVHLLWSRAFQHVWSRSRRQM